MSIFSKKEKFVLNSEQQKESMIEKLEKAGIEYKLRENKDGLLSDGVSYLLIIDARDKMKIA